MSPCKEKILNDQNHDPITNLSTRTTNLNKLSTVPNIKSTVIRNDKISNQKSLTMQMKYTDVSDKLKYNMIMIINIIDLIIDLMIFFSIKIINK